MLRLAAVSFVLMLAACGLDLVGAGAASSSTETDAGGNPKTPIDGGGAGPPIDGGGAHDAGDLGDDATAEAEAGPPVASLTMTMTTVPTTVDLEAEGALAWIHWGLGGDTSVKNEKANAVGSIPTFALTGSTDLRTYSDDKTSFTWTNGKPTATETGTTDGVYAKTGTPTFTLRRTTGVTTPLRLVVYAGCYTAKATMTVTLTQPAGGSPAPVSAGLDLEGDNAYGRFQIDSVATDPTSVLLVTWQIVTLYDPNNSNVTLAAATLAPAP